MDEKIESPTPMPSGQGDIGMNKGVVQPGSIHTENAADHGAVVISHSPNARVVVRPKSSSRKDSSAMLVVFALVTGLIVVSFIVFALQLGR